MAAVAAVLSPPKRLIAFAHLERSTATSRFQCNIKPARSCPLAGEAAVRLGEDCVSLHSC